MMRILFIVPYAPSPIYVRPYQLVRSLAALGNQITLVTQYRDSTELSHLSELQTLCHKVIAVAHSSVQIGRNCLRAFRKFEPLQAHYAWQPFVASALTTLTQAEQFDMIHVEHLRGARYGLFLKQSLGDACPPIVWDSVDSITQLFGRAMKQGVTVKSRAIARLEYRPTRRFEARLIDQFPHVTVTSQSDRDTLHELNRHGTISVVPNGVDLQHFRPNAVTKRDPATIIVSGKMSYHPNVAMVRRMATDIMPRIWRVRPDAQLMLVGKNPPADVQRLGEHVNITVTGFVNQLPPYFQRATVAAAPLTYGTGIQNKVLEAMACGTPVVASSQAASALSAEAGHDLLVIDDNDAFADQIVRVLNDSDLQQQLARAGRRYVEQQHSWQAAAHAFEKIYSTVINQTGEARPVYRPSSIPPVPVLGGTP